MLYLYLFRNLLEKSLRLTGSKLWTSCLRLMQEKGLFHTHQFRSYDPVTLGIS